MSAIQPSAPVETRQMPSPLTNAGRQRDLRAEAIANMSPGQKFFGALGEFGAAVQGKPSPLDERLKQQREERLLQATELKAHFGALEDGAKIAKGLQGDARKGFIDDYASQLETVRPGLGNVFKNIAKQPKFMENMRAMIKYLPPLTQAMVEMNPEEALKHFGTPAGAKEMRDAENQYNLKLATKQASGMIANLAKLDLPEDIMAGEKKTDKMTASLFNKIQDFLPQGHPYKLSPEVRDSINSSKETQELFYTTLGVRSPSSTAEIDKKVAERKEQGAQSTVGKIMADLDAGHISKEQADAAIKHANEKAGVTVNMPGYTGLVTLPSGKPGLLRVGKDGKTEITEGVSPPPKEVDPVRQKIADLIAKGGKDAKPGASAPAFAPGAKDNKGKPIIPDAKALGIKHKFEADPAMKGNTLGAKTARGYEVKKDGKLIGYYQ